MMRKRAKVITGRNERASLTDTYQFRQLTTNNMYFDYTLSLSRSLRATVVARGYREFRITRVAYKFKPLNDTFVVGGTGAVPTLYYVIDKTASLEGAVTPTELTSAGARPIRLDDKIITVKFKPSVLQFARDSNSLLPSNVWTAPKTSPWLSTNGNNDDVVPGFVANGADHLGLIWYVQNDGINIGYDLDVVVDFEFRKPQYELSAEMTQGLPKGTQVIPKHQAILDSAEQAKPVQPA